MIENTNESMNEIENKHDRDNKKKKAIGNMNEIKKEINWV